jgi:hypothetical protein
MSLFVQVIVSPTFAVTGLGEKASVVLDDAPLTIETLVPVLAVGLAVAPPEEVVAPPEDVLLVEFVISPPEVRFPVVAPGLVVVVFAVGLGTGFV